MKIVSLEDAQERGMIRYYTGEPCVNGHDSERYVSNKICCECSRIAARNSYRKKVRRIKRQNAAITRQAVVQQEAIAPEVLSLSIAAAALGDVIRALRSMGVTGIYMSPETGLLSVFKDGECDSERHTCETLAECIQAKRFEIA